MLRMVVNVPDYKFNAQNGKDSNKFRRSRMARISNPSTSGF
jgi:hypothetical protein